MSTDQISIIDFTDAALPFVMDTYVHSMRSAAKQKRNLLQHVVAEADGAGLREWLSKCLEVGHCVLATPFDRPDVYIGWALARAKCLDYVYVRKDARRLGFATEMILTLGDIYMCAKPNHDWQAQVAGAKGWLF